MFPYILVLGMVIVWLFRRKDMDGDPHGESGVLGLWLVPVFVIMLIVWIGS